MVKNKVAQQLLRRPIAYQPVIAKAFDSVQLAIFWSQFYYWSDKGDDPDGWIYKTSDQIYEETGLKRRSQEKARREGKKLGIIKEKKRGMPATMHFRVDVDKTIEVLEQHIKGEKPKTKEKKKIETETDGALINKIIELFEPVNPAFSRLFAQTPQRAAIDRMVKQFGIPQLEAMVQFLPTVNADRYSGISITTPYQLEANLGKLKAWGEKRKASSVSRGKEISVA